MSLWTCSIASLNFWVSSIVFKIETCVWLSFILMQYKFNLIKSMELFGIVKHLLTGLWKVWLRRLLKPVNVLYVVCYCTLHTLPFSTNKESVSLLLEEIQYFMQKRQVTFYFCESLVSISIRPSPLFQNNKSEALQKFKLKISLWH